MSIHPELHEYALELQQRIILESDAEGNEAMRPDVFAREMATLLTEVGEVEHLVACQHRGHGTEVHGYGIDDEDTLNLLGVIYRGDDILTTVHRADSETLIKRMRTFWEQCRDTRLHERLEESTDAADMAQEIHQHADRIRRVRLYLATDGLSRSPREETKATDELEVRRSFWDLSRLYQLERSGQAREPITIDLTDAPLPCLSAPTVEHQDDYRAYLTVLPASWLADLYERYGARLLELNVRSFLQATGKVNRGMRDTLSGEPERFLAYNNGLSCTASNIELRSTADGGRAIARIDDLQIVNGGQTTASIHRVRRTVDLAQVAVQAKITVIRPELVDQVVPLISRFANSQNAVNEADLTANHPFHVALEKLSRAVFSPATTGPHRTRWFYERARGQYADSVARAGTPARQRTFKQEHPTQQKFTKTDLAKYESSWACLPHEVGRGSQKNFTLFMDRHERAGAPEPTIETFELVIARAIIYRAATKVVRDAGYQAYRANLTAYAIARLAHGTDHRLPLHRIWMEQRVLDAVRDALAELAEIAWQILVDDPRRGGANVTEWAKREQVWHHMRDAAWKPSVELLELLTDERAAKTAKTQRRTKTATANSNGTAMPIDAETMLALSSWAKQQRLLTAYERKFAHSVGSQMSGGRSLSPKQSSFAARLLNEAVQAGFSHDDVVPQTTATITVLSPVPPILIDSVSEFAARARASAGNNREKDCVKLVETFIEDPNTLDESERDRLLRELRILSTGGRARVFRDLTQALTGQR